MDDVPELLIRRRFMAVPGLTATRVGANVLRVRVPKRDDVERMLRTAITPEAFDDATWALGDDESVQSLGSADFPDHVEVTVLFP
ncbi:MAG: hypothetical protein AAGA48_37280 [Myxococcota bacterium]